MYNFLIGHIWKHTLRSILWYRKLGTNIFAAVILSILALNIFSLGLFSDTLFRDLHPREDPLRVLNGILIYYFFIDFFLRLLFQKIPGIFIESYLTLPVSKRKILNMLQLRSVISVLNILPLFYFIPAAFKVVPPADGEIAALIWVLSLLGLILTSNFVYFYLDKMLTLKPRFILGFIILSAALFALNYFDIINLRTVSADIFGEVFSVSILMPITLFLPAAIFTLNSRLLKKHLYLDSGAAAKYRADFGSERFTFLDKYGITGSFAGLELKLLTRNKRSRASYLLAAVTIIFLPLYYLFMLPRLDYYPLPDPNFTIPPVENQGAVDERIVTFEVIANNLPPESHIYITGNHPNLGPWRPDRLPLRRDNDGSWRRSFNFAKTDSIRFIYTLGSWKNEMKESDGETPDVRAFRVSGDTTIVISDPNWGVPEHDLFVTILLAYFGSLLTIILQLVYGQFIFSWESGYFDMIISHPIGIKDYLKAKLMILIFSGLFTLVIFIPLVFLSAEVFTINSAFAVYNTGINSFLLIAWSTLARKRFDLNASIISTQGKGGSNFAAILPSMILPIVIYISTWILFSAEAAAFVLVVLGIIGLLLHKQLLAILIYLFNKQKYSMAKGFREK